MKNLINASTALAIVASTSVVPPMTTVAVSAIGATVAVLATSTPADAAKKRKPKKVKKNSKFAREIQTEVNATQTDTNRRNRLRRNAQTDRDAALAEITVQTNAIRKVRDDIFSIENDIEARRTATKDFVTTAQREAEIQKLVDLEINTLRPMRDYLTATQNAVNNLQAQVQTHEATIANETAGIQSNTRKLARLKRLREADVDIGFGNLADNTFEIPSHTGTRRANLSQADESKAAANGIEAVVRQRRVRRKADLTVLLDAAFRTGEDISNIENDILRLNKQRERVVGLMKPSNSENFDKLKTQRDGIDNKLTAAIAEKANLQTTLNGYQNQIDRLASDVVYINRAIGNE